MIELMYELDIVDPGEVKQYAEAKREKLKKWSNIFSTEA
jgi:hypothetical protein